LGISIITVNLKETVKNVEPVWADSLALYLVSQGLFYRQPWSPPSGWIGGRLQLVSFSKSFRLNYRQGLPFGRFSIRVGYVSRRVNGVLQELIVGSLLAIAVIAFMMGWRSVATTITDIAGFTPLLFDPTGFWNPLAIVIAGGLGGVTLVSLYFVPAVFLLLMRRKSLNPNISHALH
jgi:hypothetical protein